MSGYVMPEDEFPGLTEDMADSDENEEEEEEEDIESDDDDSPLPSIGHFNASSIFN